MSICEKMSLPGLWACLAAAVLLSPCAFPGNLHAVGTADEAITVSRGQLSGKDDQGARKIKNGDLVTIDYSVFSEDGKLVYSTLPVDNNEPGAAENRGPSPAFAEEVTAGKAARFPGVGELLAGMTEGERKKVTIPADKAFGPSNPELVKSFPLTKVLSKTIRVSAPDYVKQFGGFPSVGKEVAISPYVRAHVTGMTDTYAELEVTAGDVERFDEEFGTVEVRRQGNEFKVTLSPKIGAPFRTEAGEGRIIAEAAGSFIVDFNPPLAGTQAFADIKVLKVVRASELSGARITFSEEHDKALASASASGKPAVLVLYADWCQWCKKLFEESFIDPRIGTLNDRFVWIKVNSDRLKDYGTKYEQKGFPTIIFFNPDGTIAQKVEGYLDAAALREALRTLIGDRHDKVLPKQDEALRKL